MAGPADAAAYAAHLSALLPPGAAWARAPGSVLQRLLAGLAAGFARLDAAASALPADANPTTSYWLLPDWERAVGLPDACTGVGSTVPGRRAAVLQKLVTPETAHISEFRRVAGYHGVTLRITELDQARAEAIQDLDTANGRWRYVMWISIPTSANVRYFTTLSDVLTPLAGWDGVPGHAELECRLREMAPAHVWIVFESHEAPRRLTWLGRPLTWLGRRLVWDP